MHVLRTLAAAIVLLVGLSAAQKPAPQAAADRAAESGCRPRSEEMSLEEKVGQMLVSSFQSNFISTDSNEFDELVKVGARIQGRWLSRVRRVRSGASCSVESDLRRGHARSAARGGVHRQPAAGDLAVPLLNTADFESGRRVPHHGATAFPRLMAFGAAGDEQLAQEAGRVTGEEARALGVHVNFAPVVDVNNNPRNPVINTRSFGEDPDWSVGSPPRTFAGCRRPVCWRRSSIFPVTATRMSIRTSDCPSSSIRASVLDKMELPPLRAGIAAGADAVMTGHIEMPALDPTPNHPDDAESADRQGCFARSLDSAA